MDGEATAQHAAVEDVSRRTADLIPILASVASLVGVGLTLIEASDKQGLAKAGRRGCVGERHPVVGDGPHRVHAAVREALLRRTRRDRLRHAYMSYLFGTVVVAMTINVVAGLFNR